MQRNKRPFLQGLNDVGYTHASRSPKRLWIARVASVPVTLEIVSTSGVFSWREYDLSHAVLSTWVAVISFSPRKKARKNLTARQRHCG